MLIVLILIANRAQIKTKNETMSQQLFSGKGFYSAGFWNLTPREAYAEATEGDAVIMDVRELGIIGAKRFAVPEVLYLPLSELKESFDNIPKDIPLILADSAGLRSHEAMVIMLEEGYTNIANLAGGLVEWDRDGLPLNINTEDELSGSCMCQLRPRNRLKNRND